MLQFQRLPEQGVVLEVQHPHAEVELARQYASILRSASELSGAPSTVERAVPYAEIATSDWSLKTFFLSILTLSPAAKRD